MEVRKITWCVVVAMAIAFIALSLVLFSWAQGINDRLDRMDKLIDFISMRLERRFNDEHYEWTKAVSTLRRDVNRVLVDIKQGRRAED